MNIDVTSPMVRPQGSERDHQRCVSGVKRTAPEIN
jgi:hypothetical protein